MMNYGGKPLLPLREGYRPEIPRNVDVTRLTGGPSSQRRVSKGVPVTVSAEYLLTSCAMMYWFRLWYKYETLEGGLTFSAVLGGAERVCQFAAPPIIIDQGYKGLLRCKFEVLG